MSETSRTRSDAADGGSREDQGSPTEASLLTELSAESPFDGSGSLSAETIDRLRALDPASLGQATVLLVDQAARLTPDDGAAAAASIEHLLGEGGAGSVRVEHDVPALVSIYAALVADPSRPDILRLIAWLLRNTPRDEVFATVGTDARSLTVRARLSVDLDAAAMTAEAAPERPTRGVHTRGWARAKPPERAGPPPGGPAGGATAGRSPTRGLPPAAARPPTRGLPPMAADDVGPEVGAEPGEPATANGGGATANGGGPTDGASLGPGAEVPTAGTGPRSRTYRAYGLLESDETVLVSRPFELKVGLSPSSPPGVAGPPLELPKPEKTAYNLDIQLFADGFDLGQGESWQQSLAVSTDDLYPTAVVHLIARPIPERRATRSITATFSIEGETLGAATRQLIVTADAGDVALIAPAPTTTGTNVTAPTGEPPADVTITITRGVERGVLQWGITSKLPGVALPHDRPAMSDVGQEPKAFATAIVREFFVHDNQVGVFQLLQGIGKTIAALIPQTVRTALETANAAVAPRPLDVLLLTEEAYVPWELAWIAHPFDKTAPPYLGAQANVGRWVLDGGATPTDPPRQVDAATMAVVWGVYHSASLPPLAAAEAEAKKIQKLYGASSIDARPDPVFGLLGGVPPADILHFAVHGRYDPLGAGDGIYLVEGPPIDPFQIRGSDLSSRAPFVFLNACQVGSGQELLGSYGGIAQAFLQVGASAVVAPLWSIDDEIAQHIALEFYHQALAPADAKVDGHPAGDATPAATDDTPAPVAEAGRAATTDRPAVADLLRRARAGLVQNAAAQSSTYLAYQFYGHPSLRLSWHGEHAKGGHHDG